MLAETYSIGISTLHLSYRFLLYCLLKIILIDDSDVTGFQGYGVSQILLTAVDYPIITLLQCMDIMTEKHENKSWYFILEKVTRVNFEGGSCHIFMDINNYFNSLYFRSENIFQIINRNIKNPIYCKQQFDILEITYLYQTQFFTCSVSVRISVMIYFSSYSAVQIF